MEHLHKRKITNYDNRTSLITSISLLNVRLNLEKFLYFYIIITSFYLLQVSKHNRQQNFNFKYLNSISIHQNACNGNTSIRHIKNKYFFFSVHVNKIVDKKTNGGIHKTVTKFINSTMYPSNSDEK